MSGAAETWTQLEASGRCKQEGLSTGRPLPTGVPSQETFARVLARLPPAEETPIALEGKFLRHSFETHNKPGARVMRRAWPREPRLVLASVPADQKSHAIKAVSPAAGPLWGTGRGCTVPLDARGCQTARAAQILAQGGQYVLALPGHHEHLHHDCRTLFEHALEKRWEDRPHGFAQTREGARSSAAKPAGDDAYLLRVSQQLFTILDAVALALIRL